MEKQKAQMRVEERDRRFEELQNQIMNAPEEIIIEEAEEELPFEIEGTEEEIPAEDAGEEKSEAEELPFEIEENEEETPAEEVSEEKSEEKKDKKKTDKQVSLFSF